MHNSVHQLRAEQYHYKKLYPATKAYIFEQIQNPNPQVNIFLNWIQENPDY